MKEHKTTLQQRIREGMLRKEDILRRLGELAFGKANDCVRLVLEEGVELGKLDLSLLSEVKRSDKGLVEIRLIDRVKVLEQLSRAVEADAGDGMGELLKALDSGGDAL